MNTARPHFGFLPTRPSPQYHYGAVDIPWEQLLDAGTTIATTAIASGGGKRKRRRKQQVEEPEPQPQPAPAPVVVPRIKPPPWGPILLVVGLVGGALILSGGRRTP